MNIAIIIAGGVGSRTGQSIPKQFLTVNEKPILIYTLEKFENCNMIDEIYITVREEYFAITEDYIKQFNIHKVKGLIMAGESRNKSIANAIEQISKDHMSYDKIIIHHANMPFVTNENIEKCILETDEVNIIFSSTPQFDYMIKEINDTQSLIDRNNVYVLKAPEAMSLANARYIYGEILKERESMPPISISEGQEVKKQFKFVGIRCTNMNFKITTYEDFKMARALILNGVNG